MKVDRPELQDALAARWALGTQTPRVRRRLLALAGTRPALRERLAHWQDHGAALAAPVPPREATAGLWRAIEQRTGGAPAPAAATAPRSRWAWWPALPGLVGGALAMLLVLRLAPEQLTDVEALGQAQQALPQSYIGILSGASGKQVAWISSTRHGKRLFVKLAQGLPLAAGEQLELRALAPGQPPRVLGTLAGTKGLAELALPEAAEALFKPVDTLQIVARGAAGAEREVARGPCAKIW